MAARSHSRRALALALPLSLLLAALLAAGCAGDYVARTGSVRRAYEAYDYDRALTLLEREKDVGVDHVLYLLDRGMLLHASGRWAESNAVLSESEKAAAGIDVVSVSEEARVLLGSERAKAYRAEDFELLLVNVLKALNYAQLGQDEDALVEVRRINERLEKMRLEEKKDYEQLAIARYLGGLLYEDSGDRDAAFIDYRDAERLMGRAGALAGPLLRLAKAIGRDSDFDELRERYPRADVSPAGADEGELVVVIERGRAPEKRTSKQRGDVDLVPVPFYVSRDYSNGAVHVEAEDERHVTAVCVTSVDRVARRYLAERLHSIALKSVAGTAVKAGVAAGIGKATHSEALGILSFLVLASGNEADLRSWLSLPAEFLVARERVPAGKQKVRIEVGEQVETREVEVKPGRIALVVVRRY